VQSKNSDEFFSYLGPEGPQYSPALPLFFGNLSGSSELRKKRRIHKDSLKSERFIRTAKEEKNQQEFFEI
jgi:arylsulfatase A-like enzyme